MIHAIQTLLWYIGFIFIASPIAMFIANNLLPTGDGNATGGIPFRILVHLIMFVCIAILKSRDDRARRGYIARIGETPYSLADDLRTVICSGEVWLEVALYAAVMAGLSALPTTNRAVILAGIPVFAVVNVAITVALHRHWANARMRK